MTVPLNLAQRLAHLDRVLILGRGPSAIDAWTHSLPAQPTIVIDPTYATHDVFKGDPCAVMIGDRPSDLKATAQRYLASPRAQQPALLHAYLPDVESQDFRGLSLPPPDPILPLLAEKNLYTHTGLPYPTSGVFVLMVMVALGKRITVSGIDLYRHPSGHIYVQKTGTEVPGGWPHWHSEATDLLHIRRALDQSTHPVRLHPHLQMLLETLP